MIGISDGYTIGKALFEKAAKHYSKWSVEQARGSIEKANAAYKNPYLTKYLHWKYPGKKLLEFAGQEYPVAIFEPAESQVRTPESVLLSPLLRHPPEDEKAPILGSAKYRAIRPCSFS